MVELCLWLRSPKNAKINHTQNGHHTWIIGPPTSMPRRSGFAHERLYEANSSMATDHRTSLGLGTLAAYAILLRR